MKKLWRKFYRWLRPKKRIGGRDAVYYRHMFEQLSKELRQPLIGQSTSSRNTGYEVLDEFAEITPEGNKLFDSIGSRLKGDRNEIT